MKVDVTEGSQVILAGGVSAGEQIVIDGQEKLRDGSKVIPRPSNAPAAGAAAGASGAGAATGSPAPGAGQPGQGTQRQRRSGGQPQ